MVRMTRLGLVAAIACVTAGACWVEFLKHGSVAGREVASVVAPADIELVAKGPVPKPNTARVRGTGNPAPLRVQVASTATSLESIHDPAWPWTC